MFYVRNILTFCTEFGRVEFVDLKSKNISQICFDHICFFFTGRFLIFYRNSVFTYSTEIQYLPILRPYSRTCFCSRTLKFSGLEFGFGGSRTKNSEFGFRGSRTKN